MKKLEPIIGKTIKSVHFAKGEAGFLVQLELSFTDGTSVTFMLDAAVKAKAVFLAAEDEALPLEVRL